MLEYESFAYLDVQKTGSTFITAFLDKFSAEHEVRRLQHAAMPADYDRAKFYFISARDPLDQYISLYSYGCEGRGSFFFKMKHRGHDGLYDGTWRGFCYWLDFVLRPENANLLGEQGYGTAASANLTRLIGYQTYRVLNLAIPDVHQALKDCRTRADVREVYKTANIATFTIRFQNLREDLAKLVTTRLRGSIMNLEQALEFIHTQEPMNTSERIDWYGAGRELRGKLLRLLHKREKLLYAEFGFQPPEAARSPSPDCVEN